MEIKFIYFFHYYIILCTQSDFNNALVGVNVRSAPPNQYKYVVSIMKFKPENRPPRWIHTCTGSLISLQDVITAEHCVITLKYTDIQLKIGSIDLQNGVIFYPRWWMSFKEWSRHRRLKREFKINDIAIIRLSETVARLNIIPVPLSVMNNTQFFGLEATILGWGITNSGELPSILQLVNVRVLTNNDCEARISELEERHIPFNKRLLCTAAEPFALMHRGDSGGPLIYNGTLIAVNKGNCPMVKTIIHPNKVNIHFGSDYYRNYIADVMNNC